MTRFARRPACTVAAAFVVSACASLPADVPANPAATGDAITIERIMADPEWIARSPENAYWADDSASIYFERKRPGEDGRDLIQIDLQGKVIRVVSPEEKPRADERGGDLTDDRTRKIFSRHGDLFLKDLDTGELTQLTRTAAGEWSPEFLAGDRAIAFTRDGVLIVRDLNTGIELQALDVRAEDEPDNEPDKVKRFDYLADQQHRLFEFVRKSEEDREASRQRREVEEQADDTRLRPFYLGAGRQIRGTSLSPDTAHAIVQLATRQDDRGRNDVMPQYVNADGYTSTRNVRSKVGTSEEGGETLVLLDLERHEKHDLDLSVLPEITVDRLADLRKAAESEFKRRLERRNGDEGSDAESEADTADEAVGESENDEDSQAIEQPAADASGSQDAETPAPAEKADQPGDDGKKKDDKPARPRKVDVRSIEWTDDGSLAAAMIFSTDNKDRWLALINPREHSLTSLHHLHDPAWINWGFSEFGWLPDNQTLWYLSEESGYSHLYLRNVHESEPRQLTHGAFEVSSVTLDHAGKNLYFKSNQVHPGIYEVYRLHIASGRVEQLTDLRGELEYRLSPDESRLLLTHSTILRPSELFVQPAEPGAPAVRLTHTVNDEFTALPWVEPQIVAVPSRHGTPIHSRLYLPEEANREGVGPDGRRPAVLFVHGAGYLQNATYGWSYYFREFMFHTLLARRGYVVLDMDYRASAGYGRDWRTAIYRNMGTPELEDLKDGIDWLVEHHDVDPKRVGLYGGSYGGFLALMAMFTMPDDFAAGAALRPVADWAHYNHGYTSNILNTPMVDPEAYERSSPIEHAEGLKGALLICHGMQDDNVFFQDTVRLAQRLIELGKENWEVAMYPIEGHAFEHPSSWADEYRRIFKLFEEHLKSPSADR